MTEKDTVTDVDVARAREQIHKWMSHTATERDDAQWDIAVRAALESIAPTQASVLMGDLEGLVYQWENKHTPSGEYYAGVTQGFSYAADALRCVIAAHEKGNADASR